MDQNEALGLLITKTGSRGRPRPRDPKSGVIWGHLGSKKYIYVKKNDVIFFFQIPRGLSI